MVEGNCQKIKLLKLMELLRQETDELHPMTTAMVIRRLNSMGISCDRRTVARDIALLNDEGFEVMTCLVGREKGYYIEERSFSVPEIKILIDAVQAASFVTEKKTEELIEKLAALSGSHRADILKKNMVCFNTRKHSNENIYYVVDTLEEALCQKKKVIFYYYDLDANGQKVYRRGGHHYIVEPVALVYNEDNYYLIVYSAKHGSTANYRVDRMEQVEIVDQVVCDQAIRLRGTVGTYTEQAIKMYGGPQATLTIEFEKTLIGSVYDRFSESIVMQECGDGKYVAEINVHMSPTFWGWLFQFGRAMRIVGPEAAVAEYRRRIEELLERR